MKVKYVVLAILVVTTGFSFGQTSVSRVDRKLSEEHHELAIGYYESGNNDLALMHLDSSLVINPRNVESLYLRAVLKELNSDPMGALIDYETIVRINPDFLEAYIGKALIYHQRQNYEDAIKDLNYVLNFDGQYETRAIYFQSSGYTSGPSTGNISSVTSLTSMKNNMLYRRAIIYRDMGNYDQALEDIQQLIASDTGNPEYYTIQGMILLQMEELNGARESFREALTIDPENKSAAYQLHLLDPSYELPEVVFTDKDFHYAFAKKAFDAFEAGDYQESIVYYNYAIKAAPEEADYYSTRGLAHEKVGRFDLALKDFEKALSLDSYFVANYYRIGNILFRQSSFQKANQYYNIYLSYAPDDERILYNSAMAHLQLRQKKEGCRKLLNSSELGMGKATEMWNEHCKN